MPASANRRPGPAALPVTAAIIGAVGGIFLPSALHVVASAVLAAAMMAIAAEDFRTLRIPDVLNLLAALAGVMSVWFETSAIGLDPVRSTGIALLQGLICGGALFLVREAFYRFRSVDGLGLGDVKLGAAAGIWLGWELFAVAVALAAVAALLFVAGWAYRNGRWDGSRQIPLGVFLAPSVWVCWYAARLLAFT